MRTTQDATSSTGRTCRRRRSRSFVACVMADRAAAASACACACAATPIAAAAAAACASCGEAARAACDAGRFSTSFVRAGLPDHRFGRHSGPLSSCRSSQAALTFL